MVNNEVSQQSTHVGEGFEPATAEDLAAYANGRLVDEVGQAAELPAIADGRNGVRGRVNGSGLRLDRAHRDLLENTGPVSTFERLILDIPSRSR